MVSQGVGAGKGRECVCGWVCVCPMPRRRGMPRGSGLLAGDGRSEERWAEVSCGGSGRYGVYGAEARADGEEGHDMAG